MSPLRLILVRDAPPRAAASRTRGPPVTSPPRPPVEVTTGADESVNIGSATTAGSGAIKDALGLQRPLIDCRVARCVPANAQSDLLVVGAQK